jgi:hypothetical protein
MKEIISIVVKKMQEKKGKWEKIVSSWMYRKKRGKKKGEKVILWFKFEIWIFNILNFNILKRVW